MIISSFDKLLFPKNSFDFVDLRIVIFLRRTVERFDSKKKKIEHPLGCYQVGLLYHLPFTLVGDSNSIAGMSSNVSMGVDGKLIVVGDSDEK